MKQKYTKVHLANAHNSTMFTDCCGLAVTNSDIKCPSCSAEVLGAEAKTDHERGMIRWRYAFYK